jgi:hypothetical protein
MNTRCVAQGSDTHFIMVDVDPVYHDAVRALVYQPMEGGFGKTYPTNTPGLDTIYDNFRRDAETMVLQAADASSIPWREGLHSFIEIVESHCIDWWVCGSSAMAVRGMDITPHDIDIVVSDADSVRLGEVLAKHMIEPVVPVEGWFCRWFGRAFLHIRIEWVGGVDESADTPNVSDFGPTAGSRLDTVVWHGHEVRVPPLDLQLEVNKRRGLTDRVDMVERYLNKST